jgi:hypothetical protein
MTKQYIGTAKWATESSGKITIKDRFTLTKQSLLPTLKNILKTQLSQGKDVDVKIERILMPDTTAVESALSELSSCANEAIFNHSFRTYYWGAALGLINKVEYDPEFLLIGCLLHDLGATVKYHGKHQNCHCFAVEGAYAAEAWAKSFGWSREKQVLLGEMINLHMNGFVDISNGNEAHLLQVGAACDLVGSNYYDMSSQYRNTVLNKHPRFKINKVFTEFLEKEDEMRPQSRANLLRSLGMPLMIKINPFKE